MAYSDNIKRLLMGLCNQGRSPEEVAEFLEEQTTRKGFDVLSGIAKSLDVPFIIADWEDIKSSVPDPKTIRQWLSRDAKVQIDGSPESRVADTEPGPHQRNLFYFGQRFRDRLFLETPLDVVPAREQKSARPIWSGTPTREGYSRPRDAEETGVEQEWGPARCDAEEHSLFPFFAAHLHGHECWKLLEQVREAVNAYREASLQAYDAVNTAVRSRLPGEIASDVEGLTRSLLVDAWFQAIGFAPINLDYTPAPSLDGKGWCLRLDRWIVGNKSDPQALKPLADAHKVLDADIPGWDTTRSLGKADQVCRQVQASFQKALSPDDRLRKLLREGHCELCP